MGDPSFFVLAACMVFINKPINTIPLTNVTLVVSSVMLIRDLLLQLEEIREEMIVLGSRRPRNWRLWDKFSHFSSEDGHGCEIVKLDEIRLLIDGFRRIDRDVHHCA